MTAAQDSTVLIHTRQVWRSFHRSISTPS